MFLIPLSAFHRPNTVPKAAASSFIQLFPLHYTNTGPNTGWVLWDKAGPNVETKTQKSGGPVLCGFEGKNKVKVEVSFAICSFVEVTLCAGNELSLHVCSSSLEGKAASCSH